MNEKLHTELLFLNLLSDIRAEVVDRTDDRKDGQIRNVPSVGLVFTYWRTRHPELLSLITDEYLTSLLATAHVWDNEKRHWPALTADDVRAAPVITVAGPFSKLIADHPLICRGIDRGSIDDSPFAHRGGIELQATGWMALLYPLFDWLENEAEARKDVGFPDPEVPILSQVKEKFGTLRVSARKIPTSLTEEWLQRVSDAGKLSIVTCMWCGEPGLLRERSWMHVACDKCERMKADLERSLVQRPSMT